MRLPAVQETQVPSLSREDPLEKEMAITPVLLPGKFHGRRNTVHGVTESQSPLSDFTFPFILQFSSPWPSGGR